MTIAAIEITNALGAIFRTVWVVLLLDFVFSHLVSILTKIIQSQENIEAERDVGGELDQDEFRKYLDVVIREVKKGGKGSRPLN
jgi:hypothetical protein